MVTYEKQSPANIRTGDMVTDNLGRTFLAHSDAELTMGDYVVKGLLSSSLENVQSLILDRKSVVTISYDESLWNQDDL